MTFDQVIPIIEGKLYAWAEFRRRPDYPGAAVSRAYEEQVGKAESQATTSPQEAWTIRRQVEVYEAGIIEAALKRMSDEQRRLVYLRYVERNTWVAIAEALHMAEATVYRTRDRVLTILAYEFNMLVNGGVA